MAKKRKIFSRILNRLYTELSTKIRQKQYGDCFGKGIKYMFFDDDSGNQNKTLLFCFPAINPDKPKYNYVKTLSGLKIKKVFLLDEIGGGQ